MNEEEELLQCYNPSCGVKYKKSENSDKACVHHTGKPVFHDAYKSWSCCKKRTTDFTEFLGFKGCTLGYHSNVKPIECEKPRKNEDEFGDVVEESNPKPQVILNKPLNRQNVLERPSESLPCVELARTILPSLQTELEKLTKANTSAQDVSEENDSSKIAIGTNCKNPGCQAIYKGASSDNENCLFHPGTPIFHEGMKYWSCCQRKTSDFETFLAQVGCETSEQHLWIKKKADITSQTQNQSCRLDWHQTANFVVISVYSKLSQPEECSIQANQVKLKLSITFAGNERKIFSKEVILNGIIDPENSSVEFGASKVEITLKKQDLVSWSKLSQ